MTFQLEYNELKADALAAVSDLYQGWTKRVDAIAEKSEEEWVAAWKGYRAGDGTQLETARQLMPEWMQSHFEKFSAIYRFAAEVERAFSHYENEVGEAYRLGLQRGRELAEPNAQEWRQCQTAFDRARMLDKIPSWHRFIVNRETLRYRSREIAAAKWPDLFTIFNDSHE